jgi:hypothetical protein
MTGERDQGFYDSTELESMTQFLLEQLPEEFTDARIAKFKIFFTDKDTSQRHFAGLCRKLDAPVKFRTGFDYFILIYKPSFEEYSIVQKFLVLIHELHHILLEETEDGKIIYKLRKHNEEEDFCELPSHDQYSKDVFGMLKTKIQLFARQLL